MAVAALLGVVLYRMSILAALSVQGESVITSYAILFTTATAASINLCCIMVFNWVRIFELTLYNKGLQCFLLKNIFRYMFGLLNI